MLSTTIKSVLNRILTQATTTVALSVAALSSNPVQDRLSLLFSFSKIRVRNKYIYRESVGSEKTTKHDEHEDWSDLSER